jgi:hypothetical protein
VAATGGARTGSRSEAARSAASPCSSARPRCRAAWKLHWVYSRYDLPKTLQVGIDAFSGFEDTKADLVSHVDWFHFAQTGVPAKLKAKYLHGRAPLKKLLPYLER